MAFEVANVWLGSGVIEVTSTNEEVLYAIIHLLRNKYNIDLNKIEVKKSCFTKNIVNVVVKSLLDSNNEAFMLFWALNTYFSHNGWEPNGIYGNAFSFKQKSIASLA